MKPSTTIAFGAANDCVTLAATEDGEPVEWVRLLPMGSFAGRDGRGPYIVEDLAHAQAIVDTSLAHAASTDPVVDYDHQTDYAAKDGVGGTAPASGWIVELQARADGIFGRIDWTDKAKAALKAREYRYLSPVFPHEKLTGRVRAILRAGLTNKPNLDLGAIASEADLPGDDNLDKTKLAKALGLGDDATEDQIHAAITGLKTMEGGLATVAQAAGLPATAATAEIVTAIASTNTPDPAKFVPIETVLALQSQMATGAAETAKKTAEADVDAGIKAGKIVPALRDTMVALASSDRPAFDDFIGKAPVIVKPGASDAKAVINGGPGHLSADEKAICASMGWDEAEYAKSRDEEAA